MKPLPILHRLFVVAALCLFSSLSLAQTIAQNDDEHTSPRIPDLPPEPVRPGEAPNPQAPGAPTEDAAPSMPGIERAPLVTPAGRRDDAPAPTEADTAPAAPFAQPPHDARPAGVPNADVLPPSIAQEDDVADDELPPPGAVVGEGAVQIEVRVKGAVDGNYNAPLPDERVEFSVIQPPHQVIETHLAVTDADGVARFRVHEGAALQGFARMLKDGREIFAPHGVLLEGEGPHELTIQDKPTVTDASVVFATRIITIVELWEDYLVFTQIFRLATDQPVIYQAEEGGRNAGLRIPVPEGATGVRVVQPPNQAEAVGDAVMFRGKILPAGEAGEAPTMIVRYSLKHSNVAKVAWNQDFPFDVENLSLVVPQISQHDRHPNLNVLLDVPLCDDADRDPNVMCFSHVDETAEGVDMLRGTAVRVAHSGTVRSGGQMRVETSGWPADPHYARWAAAIAAIAGLLLGLLVWRRGREQGVGVENERARLEREQEAILQRVDALEQQLADAAILEMDYEAEKERIIGELALVKRRIRALEIAAEHD